MPKKKAVKKTIGKEIIKIEKKEPITEESLNIVSKIIVNGDLSGLEPKQRIDYYFNLCKSLKLNPLTKPFDLISLKGKLVMYANSNCAQQLRQNHNISVIDQKTEKIDDIIITTVKVQNGEGRTDTGTGAVNVSGLKGDDLANAIMKSETKAKRRATLSLGGLGMTDETELETIPNVKTINLDLKTGEIKTGDENQNMAGEGNQALEKETEEKIDKLPDNIKSGFRVLKYGRNAVRLFCEKFEWDDRRIAHEIEKIITMREGSKK